MGPPSMAVHAHAAAAAAGARCTAPSNHAPLALAPAPQVHNSGDSAFTFTTGLRSHLATRDIPSVPRWVKMLGLRGEQPPPLGSRRRGDCAPVQGRVGHVAAGHTAAVPACCGRGAARLGAGVHACSALTLTPLLPAPAAPAAPLAPLAGKVRLDYAPDPSRPRMSVEPGDYTFFADMEVRSCLVTFSHFSNCF